MTPLQILPKNVGDLGKLSVAKGLKNCAKSNKSPNLVTLVIYKIGSERIEHWKERERERGGRLTRQLVGFDISDENPLGEKSF